MRSEGKKCDAVRAWSAAIVGGVFERRLKDRKPIIVNEELVQNALFLAKTYTTVIPSVAEVERDGSVRPRFYSDCGSFRVFLDSSSFGFVGYCGMFSNSFEWDFESTTLLRPYGSRRES